jgi:FkbM family methyltransferase
VLPNSGTVTASRFTNVPTLRSAGLTFHRAFAWNSYLTRAYLLLWRFFLWGLPECGLKRHIRNNLVSADWAPFVIRRRVRYEGGESALLLMRPQSVVFTKGMFRRTFGHEPEVFRFLKERMSRYDAVVEAGANVGAYTVYFSKLLAKPGARGQIFAFEPSQNAFADLSEHLALNGCSNVQAFNRPVTTMEGSVAFYENSWDWMKGSLDLETAKVFHGGVARITQLIAADGRFIEGLTHEFNRLLVKIDVVGYEPQVLRALRGLIEAKQPDIVLGVWEQNLAGLNVLRPWLRDRGYAIYRIGNAGLEKRDTFSETEYCNYFLAPGG